MSSEIIWVLGYVGMGLALAAGLLLLDLLLLGLANRFTDQHVQRIGTQLPRVLK